MEEKCFQHNFLLSKSHKIRKSFEYIVLSRLKKRITGQYITIDYRFNTKLEMPRLGITLPSRLGKAHIRNKFKRVIREIFRLNQHSMSKHLEINVSVRFLNKDLNYFEIEKDFFNLVSKINK